MIAITESIAETARRVPMERLNWALMDEYNLELWIRRDDLLPAWCQGNKYYKLYHNLKSLSNNHVVVSFGGAFSNHLYALALAAKAYGISSIGIVRGERPVTLSPTLVDVEAAGMTLFFVTRANYRRYTAEVSDQALLTSISALTGCEAARIQLVPEGGANALGVAGCIDLGRDIEARSMQLLGDSVPFDDILLPVGTGTTLAGLALGLPIDWLVSGVSVLGAELKSERSNLSESISNVIGGAASAHWRLLRNCDMGAYARTTPALLEFMEGFFEETGILLDHVYTGKLFWAIAQQAQKGFWRSGSRLLALHTGGLQGRRGLEWN